MADRDDIALLRQTIQHLIHAVEALGSVAASEHSRFEDTKVRALDKAYLALRKTNHHA